MQYVSINDGVNWTQLGLGSGITSMIKYGAYYIAFGNGTAMYSTSPTTGWTSLGVQILNLTVVNGKLLGYSGGYICDFTNITAPVQLCYVNSSYYGDITYSNGVYAFASAGFLYWSGDGLVTFNKSQMIPNMNAYPYCRVMPWGVTSMVPNQSSYAATILFDKTAVMPPKLGDVFFPSNSTVNTHQPALKWYMRIA